MSYSRGFSRDIVSDAPVAMEVQPTGLAVISQKLRLPPSWVGMSGYLVAGVFLGLLLILALSIGRGEGSAQAASPNALTDNVVHLHSQDIATTCWQGYEKLGPARLTVALEVGIDGKIRYAAASGETPAMRGCVEAHVRAWEFLPQAQAQTMALPFEVDRR
jgi:hypothetical protein